jgi:hypothetical protein
VATPSPSHKAPTKPDASDEWSPWVVGLALFAGALMMTVGLFQVLQGLVALIDDEFYVVLDDYTFELDVTAWGWTHLIVGVLVAATGYCVVRGELWARVVGMVLAGLSAVANFLWIPYYPLWSVLLVCLSVLVILALAFYNPRRA